MVMGSYETEARSRAPVEVVWEVISDAPGWSRWAGPMAREAGWDRDGDPPPDGVGAIRRLGRKPFYGREEIVERDPPHHMAYTVLSGVPVRGYHADVDLRPDGAGGTVIVWRGAFEPKVPGTAGLLSIVLGRIVGGFARRAATEADRRVTAGP